MKSIFPPVQALLELEPEEIGEYLLFYLKELVDAKGNNKLNRQVVTISTSPDINEYAGEYTREVCRLLNEAWTWLLVEGFISPIPDEQTLDHFFITRRGQKIKDKKGLKQFTHLKFLPKQALDPKLVQKVWPSFIRGNFEAAVFAAYKEVEVRVRDAGGFTTKDYGTNLARNAFNIKDGPLSDHGNPNKGEEQAYSDVFAGVLGAFKNPSSHKDVDYDNPVIVAGLILFANTLIQIVEQRREKYEADEAMNTKLQASAL